MAAAALVRRLVAITPQPVVDALYRHRFNPVIRRARQAIAARLGDPTRGVPVTRGPLAGWTLAFSDSVAMWTGGHEPAVAEELARSLRPGMVAYDIGAHIGYTALIMARAVGPTGRVVAYEPDPANLALLQRNMDLNGLGDVVEARALALGARDGAGDLARGELSVLTRIEERDGGDVTVSSLDREVYERGLPAPDLVLIDVEGMEIPVLTGAARVLREHGPIVICEDQGCRAEVMQLLHDLGYTSRLVDLDHVRYERTAGAN